LVLLGEKGKLLLSPQQVVIEDQKDITGTKSPNTIVDQDYLHRTLQNKGIVDSGCSRHMTGNKAYLAEYQDFNGGPVAFGGSKGYITGKGKIKTGKLDFEDVCFVKELQHFNLFSVSQICDKKNKVLFTDSECLVLSPEFKLPDANQVLLRIPRQNNMYSFNLENIVPSGGLACLIAKATIDESNKWHRRLGHVNFKNLNKLVKGNLVRGLPSKIFQNDHTCVACQKGKQHKASCKAKSVSSISQPLQLLHMDLFGPTSSDEKPVDKEDQVFLEELERHKRQEQDAHNAAETLTKRKQGWIHLQGNIRQEEGIDYDVKEPDINVLQKRLPLQPDHLKKKPQPTPSPPHQVANVEPQSDPSPIPSPTTNIPDSIPEASGGNHGGQSSSDRSLSGNEGDLILQSVYDLCISLCLQVTAQAKQIKHLNAKIKKLKKQAKHVIAHHKAWGRKPAKTEPSVRKDPAFDELADDIVDYIESENAQDVGRTRSRVSEEKETIGNGVSIEDAVSTDEEKVSTDRPNVSTDRPRVSTDKEEVRTQTYQMKEN
ncbi:ribonuclease H-like domain-containing protein, partial [Tanacetum coccineum]